MNNAGPYRGKHDPIHGKTGWGQTGPLFVGNTKKYVTMACDFAGSPENRGTTERMGAGGYSIQFGITFPPANTVQVVRAVADILWSIDGKDVPRTVDIINGRVVSGTGEALKVIMRDVTPSIAGATSFQYSVSCQATKGTRPSQNQPPTLQQANYAQTIGAGVTVGPFEITQSAGIISAQVTSDDGTAVPSPVQVIYTDPTGNVVKSYVSVGEGQFVPVPPLALLVSIKNVGTNATRYLITWGIDG